MSCSGDGAEGGAAADTVNSEGVSDDDYWEPSCSGDGAEGEAAEQTGRPERTE